VSRAGKTPDPRSAPGREEAYIERAVSDYARAWEDGRAPPLEEFCARHPPRIREELKSRLEAFVLAAEGLRDLGGLLRADKGPRDPERIGPYRILEVLGRGGMGTVYLVEQESPVRRKAALKLVNPGMDSRSVLRRFEAERQALAIMEHDGIAKVFDAGTDEHGHPYFVMEYVPGVPIDRYCRETQLDLTERVRLFLDVLAAVHHAHQKGIIHRDLKPSNILVVEVDGRPRPKVIDFGLARSLAGGPTRATLLTQPGAFVGTPEYVAPEQVTGPSAGVDVRADVYSLGAILYELLTGELPLPVGKLRGQGFSAWERAILEEECEPPSRRVLAGKGKDGPARALAAKLRGDLDWITMRALEKDRVRRYQSVEAFAEDLRRHLRCEPVTAGPPSGLYRLRKLVRKHRRIFASAVAVVLALALGLAAALNEYRKARAALVLAAEKARESKQTLDYLELYLKTLSSRFSREQTDLSALLAPGSGWREDFESYPPGSFPPKNSLWVIGTDNRDARIVESGDKDRGKVLELRGRRGEYESTSVCHPLSPGNLAYVPEFTLHFFFRTVQIEALEIRPHVLLIDSPNWRTSHGSQKLFYLLAHGKVAVSDFPAKSPLSTAPPGVWHSWFLHYRRLDPGHVELEAFLNGRRILRKVRAAAPKGLEEEFLWLSFVSGDRWIQLDSIEVQVPDPARPWVREPRSGRWYGRTPRPMRWDEAKTWAEAAGGRLAVLPDRWRSDWLRATFGDFPFWIGLERTNGGWCWLDGRPFHPDESPDWLPYTPLPPPSRSSTGAETVPGKGPFAPWGWSPARSKPLLGLVEFEPTRVPVRGAALRWDSGCLSDPDRELRVLSPPVLGKDLRLRLPRTASGLPPLLAVGPRRTAGRSPFPPGGPALAPNCPLVPAPDLLLPPETTGAGFFEWRIPLRRDRYAMGERFFIQALVPASPKDSYETSSSFLVRVGTPPLGGDLRWLRSIGGGPLPPGTTPSPRYAKVLALPGGEILLAGRFRGAAAFGRKFPVFEEQKVLSAPGDDEEAFVARFDAAGRFLWAKAFGGPGDQACTDLTLGPGGGLYLTGRYRQALIAGGPGGRTSLENRGGWDIFLARFDPRQTEEGSSWRNPPTLTWIQGLGGPLDESEPALAGSEDRLFLAGGFRSRLTPTDSTGDSTGAGLVSKGGLDLFLTRFDGQGRRLWWLRGGGPADDLVRDLGVSKTGGLFACGEFRERATFPSRDGKVLVRRASPKPKDSKHRFLERAYEDPFIASWDEAGRLLWLRQPTTPGPAAALCLAPAPDGGLFVGGTLKWDTRLGRGKHKRFLSSRGWKDGFVARYEKNGSLIWATGFNSTFSGEACLALAPQNNGGVYVCGAFQTKMSIRPGCKKVPVTESPQSLCIQTPGGTDLFVCLLSKEGHPIWLRCAGFRMPEKPSASSVMDVASSIALLPEGYPVVTGYATGPALFGKGEPGQAIMLLSGTYLATFEK